MLTVFTKTKMRETAEIERAAVAMARCQHEGHTPSATGKKLWAWQYNGRANGIDIPAALAVSPGGGTVFVSGTSKGRTSGRDYAMAEERIAAAERRPRLAASTPRTGLQNTGNSASAVRTPGPEHPADRPARRLPR